MPIDPQSLTPLTSTYADVILQGFLTHPCVVDCRLDLPLRLTSHLITYGIHVIVLMTNSQPLRLEMIQCSSVEMEK